MIYVERGPVPDPLNLKNATSKASKELQQANRHLKNQKNTPMPEFAAYADLKVREALREMFNAKCAYCESPIAGSSQTDVEHYRPKAGVDGAEHPGYWWKAMVWDNLVLSCMHCNQSRRQLIFTEDMTVEQIEKALKKQRLVTTGKLDKFPTEDNVWITDHEADLSGEKPLLIDPTVNRPETLFEWKQIGNFCLIKPRGKDRRAATTIDVLGLNRRWLCEQRMAKFMRLAGLMKKFNKWVNTMNTAPNADMAAIFKEAAMDQLDNIKQECTAKQPYAAMARVFLRRAQAALRASQS